MMRFLLQSSPISGGALTMLRAGRVASEIFNTNCRDWPKSECVSLLSEETEALNVPQGTVRVVVCRLATQL